MKKNSLYFVCPTDCIETIIKRSSHHENYFYSSLGNSVTFEDYELMQIKKLIRTRGIREIYFVISNENPIVLDALGNQDYSDMIGLNNFYKMIIKQKEHLEISWQTLNPKFLILSFFLFNKIKELKNGLKDLKVDLNIISGKIYNKKENKFEKIYSDLIWIEDSILN